MNFEFNPQIKKTKEAPLDQDWYEEFRENAEFQAYEYLDGEKSFRDQQKQQFRRGEIRNPNLDYPQLADFNFAQKEEALVKLKNTIKSSETSEVVAQAYKWRLNEKIAELRLLKAAKEGNDKKVAKYSTFIYGKPEQEIFQYTMSQVANVIKKKDGNCDDWTQCAIERLKRALGDFDYNSELKKSFDLPKSISAKNDPEYNAQEIRDIFEQSLEKIFSPDSQNKKDWKIVIDETGKTTAINVSQEKKTVTIPVDRKVKEKKLDALIHHEIGTHVLRRENGERSKLMLLGLGLDRFESGEEGVATFEEQKVLGASEFSGFDGHFAISLALGLDGKKRDFRDVFEVLRDYFFVKSSKETQDAWLGANESAWKRAVRTFRGTSCNSPGVCFTKDIVYREGNVGVWRVVNENPKEEKRFMVGKYDPANSRHIWILEQLGISDEDLQALES